MNMNCVFIDTGSEKVLIETGIGEKWSAKDTRLTASSARIRLLNRFTHTGCTTEEITRRQYAPHFDHAGGNTKLDASGKPVPAFPNARYFVSGAELEHADHPTERDRASYLPDNWKPLVESAQLETKDADYEVVPGLRMKTIAGHNRSMQCWQLERDGKTMFGFADLVPMRAHVRLALDNGVRPLSGGDSRSEETTTTAGCARKLDLFVLPRSG